jgi:hypothetical protein
MQRCRPRSTRMLWLVLPPPERSKVLDAIRSHVKHYHDHLLIVISLVLFFSLSKLCVCL